MSKNPITIGHHAYTPHGQPLSLEAAAEEDRREQAREKFWQRESELESTIKALRSQLEANPYFLQRMGEELLKNSHKGQWSDWKPDCYEPLLSELIHHFNKLADACKEGNRDHISEYAADIANFAMKAHEVFGLNIRPSVPALSPTDPLERLRRIADLCPKGELGDAEADALLSQIYDIASES